MDAPFLCSSFRLSEEEVGDEDGGYGSGEVGEKCVAGGVARFHNP